MINDSMFGLTGKVALISGASSGIGLHLARVMAEAGASVALTARRRDKLASAAAELASRGHQAIALYIDLMDATTIAPAFDAAEQAFGAPVDILLNNAGILYIRKFLEQEAIEVARTFDTNLKGAFLVAQEAARRMAKQGGGAIVNVASSAGLRAAGFMSSYAASKAALIRLTEVMALELASKGVRVNALCPGNIRTDMHQHFADAGLEESIVRRIPQRRFGEPDDLDGAILLLTSDAGRYMTGSVVTVDGGQTLAWM